MTKNIIFILFIISFYANSSTSTSIKCSYGTSNEAYYCNGNNDPNITTQESAKINFITRDHNYDKTDDDVKSIIIGYKTINYFPRGLERFFKNLVYIEFYNCELLEIHQSDLKSFTKLTNLVLSDNLIEIIEEGLFNFNSHLELIRFDSNKIFHIDFNVFDNFLNLNYLDLSHNSCIDLSAKDSLAYVKELVDEVKSVCVSTEFTLIYQKFMNSDDKEIKILDKSTKSSKFYNFRPLNYKVSGVKNSNENFQYPKNMQNNSSTQTDIEQKLCKNIDQSTNFPILEAFTKASTKKILLKSDDVRDTIKAVIEENQSDCKLSQNELTASVNAFKNLENEIKNLFNMSNFSECQNLAEKFDNFERQLKHHKSDNSEEFSRIEKELAKTRHKITTTIDERIKCIEKRLVQKFEDILEDKLGRLIKQTI